MEMIKNWFKDGTHKVMAAVFGLILVLNLLSVMVSDDFIYAVNNGIFDIFRREYIQYMTWTGRSVAHIIDRTFLAFPKVIFDIFNSACFCYLIWLINVHAEGKKEVSAFRYAVTAMLVFLFVPLFGQTVLWETGACNYLWTTTIIFTFLLPYRLEMEQETERPKWFLPLMMAGGLAAGWTNENTGGACIMMVMILLLFFKGKHVKFRPWMFAGLVCSMIGFVVMILAPGNAIRSADFVQVGGRAYELVHDLVNTSVVFMVGMRWLWLMVGVGISVLILNQKREQAYLSAAYALCGAASVCAIILSPVPVYYDRSMFGAAIFVITGIMTAMTHQEYLKKALVPFAGVLAVLTVFNYGYALVDLTYSRYQYMEREAYVKQQKALGNLHPVVPIYNSEFTESYNPNFELVYLTENPDFVNNRNYAALRQIDQVTSTAIEKWNAVYKNGDPYLMNIVSLPEYLDALQNNGNYAALITCSELKEEDAVLKEELNRLGLDLKPESRYFTAFFSYGYADAAQGSEPLDSVYSPNGHYAYVSSQPTAMFSDILIDNVEYSNNNPGVTIVVFDLEKDRAVDAVTFDVHGATRSYREQ